MDGRTKSEAEHKGVGEGKTGRYRWLIVFVCRPCSAHPSSASVSFPVFLVVLSLGFIGVRFTLLIITKGKWTNETQAKQSGEKCECVHWPVHSLSSTASQGTSNIPLSSHPSSNLTALSVFPLLVDWSLRLWLVTPGLPLFSRINH